MHFKGQRYCFPHKDAIFEFLPWKVIILNIYAFVVEFSRDGRLHTFWHSFRKTLESRSKDALVLLVKLGKSTVMTVESVETVDNAETEETVLTGDLKKKKYGLLTHLVTT